jgi:drug/metabolite transporter (DMT)-like permease
MQTLRNALQSQLSAHIDTAGVTLARFILAPPIAFVYLCILYFVFPQPIPHFTPSFTVTIFAAALLQIAATFFMVLLFKQQNFSIGAGLAKSEALVAGVLGTVFFGSRLSASGWAGIMVGGIAIFILSGGGKRGQLSLKTAMIGLTCGACFALTSLFVREASIMLKVPFPHSAAWVLLCVLCLQTAILCLYLVVKNPLTLRQLKQHAGMTTLTSTTSCLGSICWFSAMALQHVAYVKTLGQIEVLLTILIAWLWMKQTIKVNEVIGLLLIAFAAILVMWA